MYACERVCVHTYGCEDRAAFVRQTMVDLEWLADQYSG